jgi:hypothetical protein
MAELGMDIEGRPYGFRVLLPLFPVGNKSDSARKLLRLATDRKFELDEWLFILLTGRVMQCSKRIGPDRLILLGTTATAVAAEDGPCACFDELRLPNGLP